MSVTAEIPASTDLLGKHVTDLQSDIVIGASAIGGTLKYIDDYTGFSGDPAEQKGNYLALKCTATTGASIVVALIGGIHEPITLDADGLVIIRVTSNTESLKITATKGDVVETKTYSLIALNLEEEET